MPTATHARAEVNGARPYSEAAGSGSALVFVHAGIADCRMWDEQFAPFADHFRVVRDDQRGYGRSAMPPGLGGGQPADWLRARWRAIGAAQDREGSDAANDLERQLCVDGQGRTRDRVAPAV